MRRVFKLTAICCVCLVLAFILVLSGRSILAKTVNISAYNAAHDANTYLALPFSGKNFQCNSMPGYGVGRYYLRGNVAAAVLSAYASLEKAQPGLKYIYAEMGWKGGGAFKPHRTHTKGLSADFITPVYKIGQSGEKVPALLPVSASNLWGYDIRLDSNGVFLNYHFDSSAMVAHIAALQKSSENYGVKIVRVIFDPPLLKILRADPDFKKLQGVKFMETKAWFPHDGHYHVDFVEK